MLVSGDLLTFVGDEAHQQLLDTFRAAVNEHLYQDSEIVYSALGADCLRVGALQMAFDWLDANLFQE